MDMLDLASDPATPPEQLTAMAKAGPTDVTRRVVANPSAPLSVALASGYLYPDELLRNPALSLWLLEDPTFFVRLPVPLGVALARCPGVTLEVLGHLAEHPATGVRLAVVAASMVTGELLERMALGQPRPDYNLALALVSHPRAPTHLLELLADQPYIAPQLGSNPRTPAYLIRHLDSTAQLRPGAAASPWLPPLWQGRYGRSTDAQVRVALAGNSTTSAYLLQRLARDDSPFVRIAVAQNPSTPIITRLSLLQDRNTRVRSLASASLVAPPLTQASR